MVYTGRRLLIVLGHDIVISALPFTKLVPDPNCHPTKKGKPSRFQLGLPSFGRVMILAMILVHIYSVEFALEKYRAPKILLRNTVTLFEGRVRHF